MKKIISLVILQFIIFSCKTKSRDPNSQKEKFDYKKMGQIIRNVLDRHKEKGSLLSYATCPPGKNAPVVRIKSLWREAHSIFEFYHHDDHVTFKKMIGRRGKEKNAKHSMEVIRNKFIGKGIKLNEPALLVTSLNLKTMKITNTPNSLPKDILSRSKSELEELVSCAQ